MDGEAFFSVLLLFSGEIFRRNFPAEILIVILCASGLFDAGTETIRISARNMIFV